MIKIISSFYINILKIFGCKISRDIRIWPLCFVSRGFVNGKKGEIYIERGCELSQGVILKAYGGRIELHQNTFLGENVIVYGHGGVEIGENTLIAMHTCIVSSNHTIPKANTLIRSVPDVLQSVRIGNDVWIGAGVKILAGVTIGDGCIVGAGAVVCKNLPANSISIGNPAKVIRYRE